MIGEKVQIPTDEGTGMPYLVLPNGSDSPGAVNYHHHYFDRRSPDLWGRLPSIEELQPSELTIDVLGGAAVRISRGQVLPIDTHRRLHEQFAGPVLPQTLEQKFMAAVKGHAGIAPRWAIDLTKSGDRRFVYLSDKHAFKLVTEQKLCAEYARDSRGATSRLNLLGEFFLRYTLERGVVAVSDGEIDEFLHTNDKYRKKRLGTYILRSAINGLLDPLEDEYKELRRTQQLSPRRNRNLRGVVHSALLPSHLQRGSELLEQTLAA